MEKLYSLLLFQLPPPPNTMKIKMELLKIIRKLLIKCMVLTVKRLWVLASGPSKV